MGLLLRLFVSIGSCLVADGQRNGVSGECRLMVMLERNAVSGECRLVVMLELESSLPYSTAIHTIAARDSRTQSRARPSATGTRNCPPMALNVARRPHRQRSCPRCTYQHVLLDQPLGRQKEDIMDAKTHCRTYQDPGRLQRVLTLKRTGPGMYSIWLSIETGLCGIDVCKTIWHRAVCSAPFLP
jgi:hypothetical protein